MTTDPEKGSRLRSLGSRIDEARRKREPGKGKAADKYTAGSLAWRMVTELVVGVLVGGAIGWGLDSLFGTLPVLLILMGLLGFVAGVRTMMRSAEELRHGRNETRPGNGAED